MVNMILASLCRNRILLMGRKPEMCMWHTGMTYMMPQWYFYVGPNYWQFLLSSSNFSVLGLGLYQLILQVLKQMCLHCILLPMCVYIVYIGYSFFQSSIPTSFPVSNQFMIGDYVMPGSVIYPSQSQSQSQSQSRKSEAV